MQLLIRGHSITGEQVNCTGEQLARLIAALPPDNNDVIWWAADVDTTTGVPHWYPGGFTYTEIGGTDTLIDVSRSIQQYLSGVFIAVPKKYRHLIPGTEGDTEGAVPFTSEYSIIEVRAFDTTYFLVAVRDLELGKHIQQQFDGEITTFDEQ